MKLFLDPIVVLDTETTGLYNDSEVIEIGAVCLDEWGRIRSRFSSLVQPERLNRTALQALSVNQIDPKLLSNAPKSVSVANQLSKWLHQIPTIYGNVICTAFNAAFDKRMLENMGVHLRWGRCIRTMTNEVMREANAQPKNKRGHNRSPSLQEACAFFSVDYPEDAHRALADAEATAKVAIHAFLKQKYTPI